MKVYYNKAEQFINTYTKKRIVIVNIWENSASHSGNEPGINTFKRIEKRKMVRQKREISLFKWKGNQMGGGI